MESENKRLIVLVEDEPIIAGLLVDKLRRAGYQVETADDGVKGLQLIRDIKPDLVLLDMMLPKLNGFGVLEALYKEKLLPKLPVVIISNSGQEVELERAQKLGIRDYLIKVNFEPNEVLERVGRILEGASAPAAAEQAPIESGKTAGVLIVEDDMFLVDLLERKFRQQGYTAYKAFDVEQARRILGESPVGIVLLDLVLPGTDGFAFLGELKASDQYKNIPVVIISNLGQKEEVERGLAAGAVDYVIKAHTTPGEILIKVEEVLKKARR
ncbi:MAG: response regulator [bacterium]|nr:response regulator [bacterium]MDZ4296579.1 response regulator [Patescibacteria group bacterium]